METRDIIKSNLTQFWDDMTWNKLVSPDEYKHARKPDYSRQTNQRNTGTSIAYGKTQEQANGKEVQRKRWQERQGEGQEKLSEFEKSMNEYNQRFKVKFPTL